MGKAMVSSVLAGILARRPVITTLHFIELRHTLGRHAHPKAAAYRWLMRRTVGSIAISTAVKDMALETGLQRRERLHLVFNGIGVPDRAPLAPADMPTKAKIIFVGRLSEEKQVDLLIMALGQSDSDFELIIAGRGDQEASLRRLAATVLPGRHVFLGWRTDVGSLISGARVLVLPSRAEPFGQAAIEAMREARPVVGFAAGGLLDIVLDKETGFLVRPYDLGALKSCLEALVTNRGAAMALGSAGRVRYLSKFTADAMARSTNVVYSAALKQSATPPLGT
jgi:glycosyltransferase involved in cell wall biosynthesis